MYECHKVMRLYFILNVVYDKMEYELKFYTYPNGAMNTTRT